jgi:DNA invertase Pin-like site-specific DNA recombinase
MRIIAAVRLSRMAEETTSVVTQTESLREYAARLGHTIIAETQDLDVSGGLPIRQRPDIGKWLTPEHLHEWDAIAGYSIDRMFRNLYDFITFYHDFLLPNGKSLVVTSENIDMSTPDGRTMAQVRVIFAENELNKITERNARAAKKLLEQGYWKGGAMRFGFMRKREGDHWILVPHPENAEIIRQIAVGVIAGLPVNAAAKELTTRGIPTGRKRKDPATGKRVPITTWHTAALMAMLKDPALAGYITWQHKFTRGKGKTYKLVRDSDGKPVRRMPSILDEDTFKQLQRALSRPTQKRGRILGTAKLVQIVFCGQCRQPLWSTKFMPRGKLYVYYKCAIQCGAKMIAQDALHAAVSDAVMVYGHLPEVKRELKRGEDYREALDENKARLQELDPDEADYEDDRQALLAERKRLQTLEAEAEPDEWVTGLTGRTIADVWEGLDETGQRKWLIDRGWRFYATRGPDGEPPLVTGDGGAGLLGDVAKVTGLTVDQVTALDWAPGLAMVRERGLSMDTDELVRLARNPDEVKRLAQQAASEGQ